MPDYKFIYVVQLINYELKYIGTSKEEKSEDKGHLAVSSSAGCFSRPSKLKSVSQSLDKRPYLLGFQIDSRGFLILSIL